MDVRPFNITYHAVSPSQRAAHVSVSVRNANANSNSRAVPQQIVQAQTSGLDYPRCDSELDFPPPPPPPQPYEFNSPGNCNSQFPRAAQRPLAANNAAAPIGGAYSGMKYRVTPNAPTAQQVNTRVSKNPLFYNVFNASNGFGDVRAFSSHYTQYSAVMDSLVQAELDRLLRPSVRPSAGPKARAPPTPPTRTSSKQNAAQSHADFPPPPPPPPTPISVATMASKKQTLRSPSVTEAFADIDQMLSGLTNELDKILDGETLRVKK